MPLKLTVLAVIVFGMCLRGCERAGVIIDSLAKKKSAPALSISEDVNACALKDFALESIEKISNVIDVFVWEPSQIHDSNVCLILPEEKNKHLNVRMVSTDLFKKASGLSTIDK